MMKNQLKQFLIAGAVLAVLAALFFGWHSWYYRPQTLADILPLSPEDIEACDVQMDYSDRENALCFDLTTGQFHELLDLLSSTTYQVPGKNIGIPADTVQITLDPHARVFFHSGGRHMELILPGNLILVNPLAFPGKSRTYLPDGNQEFQQEVIAFLESCQNGA